MTKQKLIFALWGGLTAVAALQLILTGVNARADPGVLYVAPWGDCGGAMPCYASVQGAVDAASPGDEIRVAAGTYTGVQGRPAPDGYPGPDVITQVVYISKTVTVRGGYTDTDWSISNPISYPTTLDARRQGRVLFITDPAVGRRGEPVEPSGQAVRPTIEGLRIVGGDTIKMDGSGGDAWGNDWGKDAGGGVYVYQSNATLNGNTITSNNAGWYGGGVYLWGSNATLSRNAVSSNTALDGGGIFLWRSSATLTENTVFANTANFCGGGTYLWGSPATVSGNSITNNSANYRGGGVCLEDSPATLNGNILSSNSAPEGGGAYLYSSDAVLSENSITANTASYGGGMYLGWSDVRLNGNSAAFNSVSIYGGGVYLVDSDATLSENTFTSNTAERGGGGLYLEESHVTLSGNILSSNAAPEGGGAYLYSSDAMLDGNTVISNSGSSGGGLGLYISAATLNENIVTHNNSSVFGGGMALTFSDATLNENIFAFNTTGRNGGGLSLGSSDVTLSGNTITANTAGSFGGGVYSSHSAAVLNDNTLTSNSASNGGGVCLYRSDATLINTIVANNQADSEGAGLYIQDSSPRLLHTTIARNGPSVGKVRSLSGAKGSVASSGVYVAGYESIDSRSRSNVALTNTILTGHGVGITVTSGNAVTLEATLWNNETDWGGTGVLIIGDVNIWDDPAFVDPDAGDYHLGPLSAAMDTGVDAGVDWDIDGEARPFGTGYDLGADEVQQLPLITGRVLNLGNNPIAGIQIAAGAGYSATTDANGQYTITDVLSGTYILVPTTAGYFWSPTSRTVTIPPVATGQDFTGQNVQKQVTPNGQHVVDYGDALTYTVRLVYPDDRALALYDPLPTHTTYISGSLSGPVPDAAGGTLTPTTGVTYDSIANAIQGTLCLVAGLPVTVTFAVRVEITGTAGLAPHVVNRACVRAIGSAITNCEWSNKVWNPTYVWSIYLPLVQRY